MNTSTRWTAGIGCGSEGARSRGRGRAPGRGAGGGRYWLRLEGRALARALQESGAARVDAVRDALAFREARRALYAGSAEDERKVEITGGLPNYTGIVAAGAPPGGA